MKNSSQKITPIILIIALGSFVISSSCGRSKKEEIEQMEMAKRETETEQNIIKMANNYNAVLDWEKDLRPKNFLSRSAYTFEVQRALVREDNRPVLFIAGVQDIEKHGNEYIVFFDKGNRFFGISLEVNLPILFILNCTEEQVKRILNQPNEILFENYSVVASILAVNKMRFSLTPHSLGEYEANIEVDSSTVFIAKGNCLDLLFVDDFGASEVEKIIKKALMKPKLKDERDKR